MMRAVALMLWLMLAGQAFAQSPPLAGVTPADRTAIQEVIRRQLDAFQHDDAAGAYAFAAPKIQRLFPSADVFLGMVRNGYPPVYRPKQAEFGELNSRDGDLVQGVELVGPDGKPVLALYTMQKMDDGRWLIAACVLVPSTRLAV